MIEEKGTMTLHQYALEIVKVKELLGILMVAVDRDGDIVITVNAPQADMDVFSKILPDMLHQIADTVATEPHDKIKTFTI